MDISDIVQFAVQARIAVPAAIGFATGAYSAYWDTKFHPIVAFAVCGGISGGAGAIIWNSMDQAGGGHASAFPLVLASTFGYALGYKAASALLGRLSRKNQ